MRRRAVVLGALTAAAATAARAQGGAAALQAALVKTGLYLVASEGGNTLVRFSAVGILLVDGQGAGQYRALMSQVRRLNRLGDLPVRAVVLTSHHERHAGTHAQFLGAGVPAVVQTRAASRLPAALPVDGKSPAAVVTYEREQTLRLGEIEVRLRHVGPAQTDGDTVVHFPDLRVVAVGDLYTAGELAVDSAAGGSLAGWGRALAEVLALDVDVVVPGAGAPVSRADLQALKDRIDAAVARAQPWPG